MKVALISEHASPLALAGSVDSGGQNIYVAHVARELNRLGHTVDVFTRRDRSLLPATATMDGVRVVHVPAGPPVQLPKEQLLPYMPEFAEYLVRFSAESTPYDVTHANFFMSGVVGLELKRRLGTPLVTTFHALGRVRRIHQGANDGFPDERFAIEDSLVRHSDSIIAECPQDEEDLVTLYNADPAKIDRVPCGFDPAEFQPLDRTIARNSLDWPQDAFIVLQLGRIVPRKGIDNVVEGIGALRRYHGETAHLYVVGGNSEAPNALATPEMTRLGEIAQQCGVANTTTFLGRRRRGQLCQLYSAADVFVTTPWYEPFGITPLEAMACALPVVGADVGGIRYSVRDGETGFLVPPRDPLALAQRLSALRNDPALRERMGQAGLARAKAMFTWAGVAQSLAHVYARVAQPLANLRAVRAPESIDEGCRQANVRLEATGR
ncbi:glycosyltransferase family 4 protein [Pararobbsia alpina]|uniref:D-inositol 3-phosphate glycosyltransferase n=1 Tax=Pararobbsia alpina TaxID=621374 RepID=A0A6S7BI08_9BURK|nr:glycosyltransferase family 1 protein [Pararobbsia alpina]CAB3800695.1 D-inositol 3-phosphate glycosyltransferase [Pararobbsia alpina]